MSERLDRELDLRAIAGFAVGLVVVTVLSAGLLWYFAGFLRGHQAAKDPAPSPLAAAGAPYQPPGPRLQTDPAGEMAALRAAEEQLLGSYGWVDRQGGIARIPIERAISLMVGDAEPAPPAAAEAQR